MTRPAPSYRERSGPEVHRTGQVLEPDPGRTIARAFLPGESNFGGGRSRLDLVADRILGLDPREAAAVLSDTVERFGGRHRDMESIWNHHFELAARQSETIAAVNDIDRRLLIGAYLTQEYSFEAVAITNPSIVPYPDIDDERGTGFVMSSRAIGEGHISSIEFRAGWIGRGGTPVLDDPSPYACAGTRRSPVYEKEALIGKLGDLGAMNEISRRVFAELGDTFRIEQLDHALENLDETDIAPVVAYETRRLIHWLASSNYEVTFDDVPLSERVLVPSGPADSRGMEDARFVRFVDGGEVTYYATYTAFDGFEILPQLIETPDFRHFRMSTLSGSCAHNKGIALFPRKVDGLYMALSRHDQESTFVLRSDDPRSWTNAELVYRPTEAWESVQGGNCGSPLETEEGWLVITHGVGPMRRYVLGAILLDLDEPSELIGRLTDPLLEPAPAQQHGYVPNVVYSCGSLIHDGMLVIPYGFADYGVSFATVPVDEVLAAMVPAARTTDR